MEKLFGKEITEKDSLGNKVKRYIEIEPEIETEPDFLFMLCNYHHYSTNLAIECKVLPDECKFINASHCGYGLYKDMIKTNKELDFISGY